MKHLFTLLALIPGILMFGQVADRTETDCDGNQQSIYDVLDSGKPLIIASKGLDCSICMSQAANVGNFAANQPNIAIWGAMFYLYSNNEADCPSVDEWESDYNWTNIFAFPDLDEFWVGTGAPRYYVIDPTTREIVYQGSSFTTASNEALGLITVGIEENRLEESLNLFSDGSNLIVRLETEKSGFVELEILNILGESVMKRKVQLSSGQNEIRSAFSGNYGIYIANLRFDGELISKKFLVGN